MCLIRLLSISAVPFQQDAFHTNAYRLFDAVFAEDVYRQLGLTAKQQTFEKEAKLRDMVSQIESEFSEVLHSLTSLDVLPAFRKSLMRVLNGPLSKAILWPFLPRALLDVRLSELFITAKEYVEETGAEKFRAYYKAVRTLEDYATDLMSHRTKYTLAYLSPVSGKIADLLKHDFDSNPLSKPARLVIKPLEKQYPLREQGKQFPIVLSVLNEGPGYASNVFLMITLTEDVEARRPELYLGDLEPGSSLGDVEIPCKVVDPQEVAFGIAEVRWTNFDGTTARSSFEISLISQRSDIPWAILETEDPYSLQAVITTDRLVGRTEVLNQLTAGAMGNNVASFYVYGQKRVGKTSLVRTFENRLRQTVPYVLPIYLEGGDYVDPDPAKTVERLGTKLCEKLILADSRLRGIPVPVFGSALAPLTDFLAQVAILAPELRVIFILDEFDDLPPGLYERTPIGDAFFLTIRSISGKEPFGVILVGGEKMEFVMSRQGAKLNNFDEVRLDYFDRETCWADFADLVRRPIGNWFEVSDSALLSLYEESAGNPTSRSLFVTACSR